MMFFKTKLFILLVLIAVATIFYYFGDPQKLFASIVPKLKDSALAPIVEKMVTLDTVQVTGNLQGSVQDAQSEISDLTKRTIEVSKHAGNVLGSSVQPASQEDIAPHEKAFEYGKYIYCKQVVADYEKLNPSLEK